MESEANDAPPGTEPYAGAAPAAANFEAGVHVGKVLDKSGVDVKGPAAEDDGVGRGTLLRTRPSK